MNQFPKKVAICFILFFLSTYFMQAQQFKWARGGGASTTGDQSVAYMCTDPNGNVYALSIVGGDAPIVADTFHSSFYYGTNPIILITSYNCNGQMRWAKPIGSPYHCTPYGITADSLGNIYVAGYFYYGTGTQGLHIGNDTTINTSTYLALGIIQFDTLGHFHWIRFVGTNTFSSAVVMGSLADPLTIDNSNNVHYFCYIQQTGIPIMTGVTSIYGVYDITYNTACNMLSAVRLDLDSQWYLNGVVLDQSSNKLYVCGEVNSGMGAGVDTFFAAAFDASRNRLWQYFALVDTMSSGSWISAISFDQSKHLHFVGGASSYTTTIPTFFCFNGDTVFNTHFPRYTTSIIMTTDTNGHPLKIKSFDASTSINGLNGITQLPNSKVAASGIYGGVITDGTVALSPSLGQDPFLEIVDSGGDLVTLQPLTGDGFYDAGTAITSDRIGNVYIGGKVIDSIWAGTLPAFHSTGGATNFFIMKYGVDCSCTSMPIASAYTDTGTHTVGFTYTGSTTGIDSVVWNFDDGSTAIGASVIHTYSMIGTYRACVTIYTACGSDLYCKDVTINIPSLSSTNPHILGNISIYPNPTTDAITVNGISENTKYQIWNISGFPVLSGKLQPLNNYILTNGLASGIYVFDIIIPDGNRVRLRFVKE